MAMLNNQMVNIYIYIKDATLLHLYAYIDHNFYLYVTILIRIEMCCSSIYGYPEMEPGSCMLPQVYSWVFSSEMLIIPTNFHSWMVDFVENPYLKWMI